MISPAMSSKRKRLAKEEEEEAPPEPDRVLPSEIGNKVKRSEVAERRRIEKKHNKREARNQRKREREELGDDAPPTKIPKTLENTREYDETVVTAEDQEVLQDEATDEFAKCFSGQIKPKILLTTSRKPVGDVFKFIRELRRVIPRSKFHRRAKFDIKEIVKFAKEKSFSDIFIINEDRKTPQSITLIHMPDGPTAHFKLTGVKYSNEIEDKAQATKHLPEVILNNFTTRLGHTVGRMLAAMFPQNPQFLGRQVVTFHNQRDFIFFRRHRYIFEDGKRVNLQEIGPEFCLKLQWLQKGTFDTKFGDYEWHHKTELDTSRRRFFL